MPKRHRSGDGGRPAVRSLDPIATAANDAFGLFLGQSGTGVATEVMRAPDQSGGPAFIDGRIAGITSYGLRLEFSDGSSSDIDTALNSSYGEFGGDTRVSHFADWIIAQTGVTAVSARGGLALVLLGLGVLSVTGGSGALRRGCAVRVGR